MPLDGDRALKQTACEAAGGYERLLTLAAAWHKRVLHLIPRSGERWSSPDLVRQPSGEPLSLGDLDVFV